MSFVLWYPTPEYSCFCAFGGSLPSLSCFFSCGAGALSERAVLSLDTPFPSRRTKFLFSPSACD
jgi:hypothetical protein